MHDVNMHCLQRAGDDRSSNVCLHGLQHTMYACMYARICVYMMKALYTQHTTSHHQKRTTQHNVQLDPQGYSRCLRTCVYTLNDIILVQIQASPTPLLPATVHAC